MTPTAERQHTFPKREHLCGKMRIAALYEHGRRFTAWPLRVTYAPAGDDSTQVLVWAPKSLFRHAVQRNRLRRQMREAYRLNKQLLAAPCHVAFNYIDKAPQPYRTIERAMQKALARIQTEQNTTRP
ncbi:MAG: ribonuclease P protein component [Paludibacteraceae bacterium]|nr:ribonuclease P protein component [Paludibacteraceae bacterium]